MQPCAWSACDHICAKVCVKVSFLIKYKKEEGWSCPVSSSEFQLSLHYLSLLEYVGNGEMCVVGNTCNETCSFEIMKAAALATLCGRNSKCFADLCRSLLHRGQERNKCLALGWTCQMDSSAFNSPKGSKSFIAILMVKNGKTIIFHASKARWNRPGGESNVHTAQYGDQLFPIFPLQLCSWKTQLHHQWCTC